MDGDPIRALTGRRRTRPTSIGCRKPQQPKPGRAPLIAGQAAVQINRATSLVGIRCCQQSSVSGGQLWKSDTWATPPRDCGYVHQEDVLARHAAATLLIQMRADGLARD